MDHVLFEDGTLVCNGSDVRITIVPPAAPRQKPLVTVAHHNQDLLTLHANLLLAADIEQLTRNCGTRVATVDWHHIFTQLSTKIPPLRGEVWEPVVRTLSSYRPERKEYLWYPALPKGEPTLLDGDPGQGKSAMVIKVCVHLTTGKAFPTLFADRPECDFAPQHVVIFTYEDSPSSTILPRVAINGGNPALVHIVEGKRNGPGGSIVPITMQDTAQLMAILEQYRPALMVFDPIQSFFGPRVDMNNASDTRPVLDGVRNLCKAYGCTPLYVRHNGKGQHAKAMHSGLGSIDITANMRSALALYEDQEHPNRRILAQTKTNGRKAPSMQCRLSSGTHDYLTDDGSSETLEDVRMDWDGLSSLTAADLNARQWMQERANEEEKSAIDQAREFLQEALGDGQEVLYEDVMAAAKQAGIATATLRRAKALEKVKVRKQEGHGKNSPWVWCLPLGEDATAGVVFDG
jgi:hypothetical protein